MGARSYQGARWYDPANGRFNRLDPFFGNLTDPQSLHKYLYVHGDPVNGIDPSGLITLSGLGMRMSVGIFLTTVVAIPSIGGFALYNASGLKPDAFVMSISVGLAAAGLGVGVTGHIVGDFKTKDFYFIPGIEGGTAPLSRFKKETGLSVVGAAGFAFNMNSVNDLAGFGFTATFPAVGLRYLDLLIRPFTRGQALNQAVANYLLAIQRLKGGNIVNQRTRTVAIATQSTSGASVIQLGQAVGGFAFGSTVGFGFGVISSRDAVGAVKFILNKAKTTFQDLLGKFEREQIDGVPEELPRKIDQFESDLA